MSLASNCSGSTYLRTSPGQPVWSWLTSASSEKEAAPIFTHACELMPLYHQEQDASQSGMKTA